MTMHPDPDISALAGSLTEAGEYLLMKRGLYYRPENAGYTGVRDQAGRYHASDASPDSGVTAIHLSEAPLFSPACWNDIKVKHLLARIAELEEGLRPFAEVAEHDIGEGEADGDWFRPVTFNMAPRLTVGHLRTAAHLLSRSPKP